MKFLCDVMLAKTGRWLRMLGFDTIIATEDLQDSFIVRTAREEKRTVLTRDKFLFQLAKAQKVRAVFVSPGGVQQELKQIRMQLKLRIVFPSKTRCPACNARLKLVPRSKVLSKIPSGVVSNKFWLCPECGKTYWQGSHWKRIVSSVAKIKKLA